MNIDPNFTPTYEEISSRAFTIWEQHGRPLGEDLRNWLLAEEQLRSEHSHSSEGMAELVTHHQAPAPSEQPAPAVNALREAVGKATPGKAARKRKAS